MNPANSPWHRVVACPEDAYANEVVDFLADTKVERFLRDESIVLLASCMPAVAVPEYGGLRAEVTRTVLSLPRG
jgi:hypothetical protein